MQNDVFNTMGGSAAVSSADYTYVANERRPVEVSSLSYLLEGCVTCVVQAYTHMCTQAANGSVECDHRCGLQSLKAAANSIYAHGSRPNPPAHTRIRTGASVQNGSSARARVPGFGSPDLDVG